MGRDITIIDTTLRDGHQSLWASRMPTEMMLPVAQHQNRSGLEIIDVGNTNHFSVAVRYLHEDPWERLRALRRVLNRPALLGSFSAARAFQEAAADISDLSLECAVRNGIDVLRVMHGLVDVDRMVSGLVRAKKLGAKTIAAFVFSLSPVHTDEFFASRVRQIVKRASPDWIMIKDSGGLLTPERTGPLVDAIGEAAAGTQVTLHTHCMTGLAGRVYMVGAQHGVDNLQCGIWPLAQGSANPSMQATMRNLRAEGYTVNVDDREIDAASGFLLREARRRGFPPGAPQEYDAFHYHHQVPGGMISHFRNMLRLSGLLDRLTEVLEEIGVVREELGWPTMVTPFSQFVGVQALFNIISGERYRVVPDEVKLYVLGAYGTPLAPIKPDVLDRITENGSADIKAPKTPEPALPALRNRYPGASDEELVLRYMCAEDAVEAMLMKREETLQKWRDIEARRMSGAASDVLIDLVGQIAELTEVGEMVVEKGDVHLRVRA